jgi:hypothetical protein
MVVNINDKVVTSSEELNLIEAAPSMILQPAESFFVSPGAKKFVESWCWGQVSVPRLQNRFARVNSVVFDSTARVYLYVGGFYFPFICMAIVTDACWLVCKATCLQELAQSIVMTYGVDGPEDMAALSRLGAHGWSDGNIHRDLMTLFKNLKAPEPEKKKAPVFKKDAGQWRTAMELVSVFLPHDWFECIASHELMDPIFGARDVAEFWKQVSDDDPRLFKNPMKQVSNWKKKFIPFLVHGDGAPHHKHDSIQISSFKSMLTKLAVNMAMLLLAGLPEAMRCTEKRCNDRKLPFLGNTEDFLGRYYVWSWNAVFEGKHPATDPWEQPFAAGSRRAKLAGQLLDPVRQLRGCIWRAPADGKHLSDEYGLPSHSSTELCMSCPGNDSNIPWRVFSSDALW